MALLGTHGGNVLVNLGFVSPKTTQFLRIHGHGGGFLILKSQCAPKDSNDASLVEPNENSAPKGCTANRGGGIATFTGNCFCVEKHRAYLKGFYRNIATTIERFGLLFM